MLGGTQNKDQAGRVAALARIGHRQCQGAEARLLGEVQTLATLDDGLTDVLLINGIR